MVVGKSQLAAGVFGSSTADLRVWVGAESRAAVLTGYAEAAVRLVDGLRAECAAVGGSLVVLDGPAATTGALDTWGPIPALDLMRRTNSQYPWHKVVSHTFPLEQINEAFVAADQGKVTRAAIVP